MSFILARFRTACLLLALLAPAALAPTALATTTGDGLPWAGRSLGNALEILEDQGLRLIYTSFVVSPELRVLREPTSSDPEEILQQLLAPHGLVIQQGPGGVLTILPGDGPPAAPPSTIRGLVVERPGLRPLGQVEVHLVGLEDKTETEGDGTFELPNIPAGPHLLEVASPGYLLQQTEIVLTPDQIHDLRIELIPVPTTEESIEVTSSRLGILGEGLSSLSLVGQSLSTLPSVAGDVLRPLTRLPGASGNDISARPRIRGGRRDEVMVRLDHFEVFEAYHLRDIDSALSILAPNTLASAELLTGGFSAEYGDRMGGVIDFSTLDPTWDRQFKLDLSAVNGQISGSGTLGGRSDAGPRGDGLQGHWLASVRGGLLQLAADVANLEEEPHFWDAFSKIDYQPRPGQSLRGYLLSAYDRLEFVAAADEDSASGGVEIFRTNYRNDYLWLTHLGLWGKRQAETRFSWSGLDRGRRGTSADGEESILRDQRDFEVASLAQDWKFQIAARGRLKLGFEFRSIKADYDYFNTRQQADRLQDIFDVPGSTTTFQQGFLEQQYAVYISHRQEFPSGFTAELGLRFDHNTVLHDETFSPRLGLSYAIGPRTRFTGAWGFFHQTQRLYELQVEDGEDRFSPVERAEHRILGIEHDLGLRGNRPLVLRLEVYERRIRDPRVRFENLFDPISLFPELEADRIRITPRSGLARGVELLVSGRFGARVNWFASYTWSRTEERIEDRTIAEGRTVARKIDQPHKVGFDISYHSPRGWTLSLAGEYHTGWPTTAVTLIPGEGDDVGLIVGPLHGERHSDYSRLDLHLSRTWSRARGELSFYFDLQNFTSRRNVRGFEIPTEVEDDEPLAVKTKYWAPVIPNLGIRWAF